ncbi:EAL domain-containing protein [Nitrosophilus kaiyonis]|uniref:EAL domain-containing protein n=1 Tax=Nitrosophilus kaiyonis TaxID=2930200 RepID=UPI0024904A7E|nr:EAL domain-containing protein [Nitrosophilus kaiyonis]
MRHIYKVLAILIAFISILIVYLYISTFTIEKGLTNKLNTLFLKHVKDTANNINLFIKNYYANNLYQELKEDKKLRDFLQNALTLSVSYPNRYVYILYRDKKGKYRYLLDGSKEDKGEFDQKLDVDKKEWDLVYKTKKDKVIQHRNSEFLYITYLKPIVKNGNVDGIIAIDFTSDFPKTISDILSPLKQIFSYIFITFFIIFLILIYQFYLYYKTKKLAIIDPLTEAYNRTYLRDFLNSFDPNKYSILMVDIDHFKKINDNYGHKVGDIVLREFSTIVKRILRDSDIIIRYGGEEFLIFLNKENSSIDPIKIAERIRETFEKTSFNINKKNRINITVSIGVISYPEKYKKVTDAIKKADEMLYIAKKSGRNKIIQDENSNFIKIVDKDINFVKEAIEENRIILHYQPIYDIINNKIKSYEALVRLIDTDGTVIYPNSFLRQIAFTTVYNNLTKKILEIVFETIKKTQKTISINLNFSDIQDNKIFNIIENEIKKNIKLANYLIIELLENEALSEEKNLSNKLLKLKKYGVNIAIDDFGSGYSNFGIFRYLPIDILKIDGSLIKEINSSKISFSIVNSIVFFAKEANIEIVAEFVENENILNTLKNLNIKYAQGYLLGKPQPQIIG